MGHALKSISPHPNPPYPTPPHPTPSQIPTNRYQTHGRTVARGFLDDCSRRDRSDLASVQLRGGSDIGNPIRHGRAGSGNGLRTRAVGDDGLDGRGNAGHGSREGWCGSQRHHGECLVSAGTRLSTLCKPLVQYCRMQPQRRPAHNVAVAPSNKLVLSNALKQYAEICATLVA